MEDTGIYQFCYVNLKSLSEDTDTSSVFTEQKKKTNCQIVNCNQTSDLEWYLATFLK